MFVWMDDQYYADLSLNYDAGPPETGLPACDDEAAGAVRAACYLDHARACLEEMWPFARLANQTACIGAEGNHIVESQYPGNATPLAQSLVDDAIPAFDALWMNGQLGKIRSTDRYFQNSTAKCWFFFVNALTYDNDGGSHGDEGRAILADPAVLLGDTQMADLIQAIKDFGASDAKFFLLMGSVAFANDAASPASAGVGWAIAEEQRDQVINTFLDNTSPDQVLVTTGGHWHFPVITRQGLPDNPQIAPYFGAAPLARPMPSNYDTAFLSSYDGGPIFKSDLGAPHDDTTVVSCFGYLDINEVDGTISYSIIQGDGTVLDTGNLIARPSQSRNARNNRLTRNTR